MAKRKIKKLPTIMTKEEVKRFLGTFNKDTRTGYRDWVLAYLLFNTGMRVSEALDCTYANLFETTNYEGETLYNYKLQKSKNGSQAIIPIPKKVYKHLMALSVKYNHNKKGHVFTTIQKAPLQYSFVYRKFREKGVEATLPYNMHPHQTRHYFLSTIYNSTRDIVLTQQAARHSVLSSTQCYVHLNPEAIRDAGKYIEID